MLPSARFVVLKKSNGCVWRFFWRARTGNIVIESSNGTLWEMLDRKLIDKYTCVALEYGTYAPDNGLRAMQGDHWLHNQSEVNWQAPITQTIKAALKKVEQLRVFFSTFKSCNLVIKDCCCFANALMLLCCSKEFL